jgi:hypothetical protein
VHGAAILRVDRAHEQAHRRMMRLHALRGDRTAALRQYEQCVAALAEELGVQPTRRTLTLYDRIRADRLMAPAVPAAPAALANNDPTSSAAAWDAPAAAGSADLAALCTDVNDLRMQMAGVLREMQVLKQAIGEHA